MSPENMLIGQKHFGVEDQVIVTRRPFPYRVGGVAGYETTLNPSGWVSLTIQFIFWHLRTKN